MKLSVSREPRFQPRKPRLATFVNSAALLPDDREVPIVIRNVSPDGFMGVTEHELAEETWFGVVIPGRGIVRAQIRWFDGGLFGARFERPLDVKLVESL
ncbi:MAG: hypothetical protein QOH81_2414 [Sphingomonadales bacterium]|jgi:hypothetical protein|nr:hypothetical protein [Sphingomonadales bacterium]